MTSRQVGVVYFDGLDVDAKNKAARLLPLGEEGTIVELRGEVSLPAFSNRLSADHDLSIEGSLFSEFAPQVSGGAGAAHCFALVAPSREFLFGVPTAEKAAEWVGAIQAEIDAAQVASPPTSAVEVDVDAALESAQLLAIQLPWMFAFNCPSIAA